MPELPVNQWGDTSPTLKIAKHFGIEWDWTLAVTDNMLHGRTASNCLTRAQWEAYVNHPNLGKIVAACEEVANRTRAMWAQGAVK